MKLDFEYGLGTMQAELPDNTDVFISGETVKDPACIPEDQLEAAYLESLAHPIGMPTLTELAHKGTTVTIIVPDRVKGGEQPTSHRKLSIKYILKELYAAGVEKKDILFIISNGLHPRSKASDAKAIFGDELFNEFWHSGQIISHDSEDQEHMIYLGTTKRGDPVYMNKYVMIQICQSSSVTYRAILTAVIQAVTSTVQQVSQTGDVSPAIMCRLLCTETTLHLLTAAA